MQFGIREYTNADVVELSTIQYTVLLGAFIDAAENELFNMLSVRSPCITVSVDLENIKYCD